MDGNNNDKRLEGLPKTRSRQGSHWVQHYAHQRQGIAWRVHPRGDKGMVLEMFAPSDKEAWRQNQSVMYDEVHANIDMGPRGTYRTFSDFIAPKGVCPFTGEELTPRRRVHQSVRPAIHAVNKAWADIHRARGYFRMEGAAMLAMELEAMASYVRKHAATHQPDGRQQSFWDEHTDHPSWVWEIEPPQEASSTEE